MTVTESTCHAEDDHPGTVRNNHSPAAVITASPVLWRHSSQRPSHQPSVQPDMSQAVQCINLMALGKTGNGKSSLLNDIAGYEVFKQKASVKSQTKEIQEHRCFWAPLHPYMHNKADFGYPVRIIDTPGFGDSQLRDSEFFPMIREQLIDLIQQPLDQGGGIHCIFLVYKMTSSIDAIFTSLNIFHELIQPFTGVWENVVLVFTHAEPSTLHYHQQYKMKLKTKVSLQIKEKYQLTKALPMVFLSTQTYTCSYLKGLGECDCERGHRYHADCRRRLYEQVKIRSTRPFHLDDCEYPPSSLSPTMEMSTIQESSLME